MTLLCLTTEPSGAEHASRPKTPAGSRRTEQLGLAVAQRDPFAVPGYQRSGTRVWLPLSAVEQELEQAELAAALWSGRARVA